MGFPERRPGYVPEAVWRLALEIRADTAETPSKAEDLTTVSRLLAPGMRQTWENLERQDIQEEQSWRLLLDLFYTSRPGRAFHPEYRESLKRVSERLPKIAKLAEQLSEQIEQVRALALETGIQYPPELGSLGALLDDMGPPIPAIEPRDRRELSEFVKELDYIEPAAMLEHLATVAKNFKPTPETWSAPHPNQPKAGFISEWVRFFDSRYSWHYRPLIPERPEIGAADLARIGSAVLQMELKGNSVSHARQGDPGRRNKKN